MSDQITVIDDVIVVTKNVNLHDGLPYIYAFQGRGMSISDITELIALGFTDALVCAGSMRDVVDKANSWNYLLQHIDLN